MGIHLPFSGAGKLIYRVGARPFCHMTCARRQPRHHRETIDRVRVSADVKVFWTGSALDPVVDKSVFTMPTVPISYSPDEDRVKSGFGGEHAESNQRLMYT
jgi:hypothetical protein